MTVIHIHPPPPRSISFYLIEPNPTRIRHISSPFHFNPPFKPSSSITNLRCTTTDSSPPATFLSTLDTIRPYLLSEWKPIIHGWAWSAVSAFSLSKIVPKSGEFSSILNDSGALKREGSVLAILVLVRLVSTYLQQAFLWDAALNSAYRLRVFVFGKVIERDLALFESGDDVSSGDIAHRVTSEAADVADTVFALLNAIVPNALQLSAMAALMLTISPALTLISALVVPSVGLVIAYLGSRLQKISMNAHLSTAALSAYLNEVLPSILFIKASSAEWLEKTKFERLARVDLTRRLKKRKMKALIPQIVQVVYMGALFVFFAGYLAVYRGSFNGRSIVSFLTSLVFLVEPIQDVGKAYNELKQGEPAIKRLFALCGSQSQVIEKPDAIDVTSVRGEVKFRGISFHYSVDLPLVLKEVDLLINAGETVALVGPSGGGKTTLVKLLLRLYDPICGSIHIDDHDIRSMKLSCLRRHVGLVSQDIILFSGTVAENIGYMDLLNGIDRERVEQAAKTANADEFIRLFPHGYETKIGSRGVILSGGQKQRLAIARALYEKSSILILDEATSALDSSSELLVRQALERLTQNHTVLVIAHRLETVLMAKRLFLLQDGKVVEIPRSSLLRGQEGSISLPGIVI